MEGMQNTGAKRRSWGFRDPGRKKLPWAVVAVFAMLPLLGPFSAPPEVMGAFGGQNIPESFTELAKSASPAVVNIRTEKTVKNQGRIFEQFFGKQQGGQNPFQQFFNQQPGREFTQKSLGSGFVMDKKGYIVTNNHVVKDADQIRVKLKGGKEYDAEVVGTDDLTDLALIRIDAGIDLPVLALGDSDKIDVGQWVVAISSPFGLEQTVTSGIVSAKGRVIGAGPYDDFIQTDASINPGNSGGPLIDMEGNVVGINTAIAARADGIGFAIPSNMARSVIEQLKEKGKVSRGWLGVGIQDLDDQLKEYYNVDHGVLVIQVFPGDPAEKAGVRRNDIILSVGGKKVDSSRSLSRIVSELKTGENAKIRIQRDGKVKTVKVKISERNDADLLASRDQRSGQSKDELGIQVAELTPSIARKLQMEDVNGVIVANVSPDSSAQKAGLRKGDVIMEVDHKSVGDVNDFKEIVLESIEKKEPLKLYVGRPGQGQMVITIEMAS